MKIFGICILVLFLTACNTHDGETEEKQLTDTILIDEDKIIIDSSGHTLPEDSVEM